MSENAKDAQDTRWLNGPHAKEHGRMGAPMPGNCVICRFARRLKQVKAENKRLRVILNRVSHIADEGAWLNGGHPR